MVDKKSIFKLVQLNICIMLLKNIISISRIPQAAAKANIYPREHISHYLNKGTIATIYFKELHR